MNYLLLPNEILCHQLHWSLQKSHNMKIWETSDTSPMFIVTHAHDILHEWSCMQKVKNLSHNLDHNKVDAVIFDGNSTMGYGICFRSRSCWTPGISQNGNFQRFVLCYIRKRKQNTNGCS